MTTNQSANSALDPSDRRGSPDRFGYEWGEYSEIRPEYEEQFKRWTVHLKPEDWKGLSFLDVGCGMGRNSYWPLKYGAANGVAIDIDDRSLRSAQATLAGFSNVVIRKLSAYAIDYDSQFDVAFSIGVIHHVEKPEVALSRMVKATKPGGRVMIWVYGLENNRWIVNILSPLRKALFGWLPVGFVHHLSLYPTILLSAALKLGIGRLQYHDLLRTMKFRHLRSIVFDQMLPKIANYWSKEEVEALMSGAGLENVQLSWVNEMSWSAIGTRPKGVGA